MPRVKVTLLVPNLSGNNMYRTFLLYRALEGHYDVNIVGFLKGTTIWQPLASEDISIQAFPLRGWLGFVGSVFKLLPLIKGSVVIACKPRITSYGVALLSRLIQRTPIILDIDDDELAMTKPPASVSFFTALLFNLKHPDGYWSTRFLHRYRRSANHAFCVSEHFRKIYGGSIVPHGQDPAVFDPARFDRDSVRAELGVTGRFVVVFVGTPRPHKGLEVTLEGLARSGVVSACALIVGVSSNDGFLAGLMRKYGNLIVALPPQPATEVPRYLAAGDAVVLAQSLSAESMGQMPAKLTDAMLMGLPVIATRISDIPRYLDGCGILLDQPTPELIGGAISYLAAHPEDAKSMGITIRQQALGRLTFNAMLDQMSAILHSKMHQNSKP